jgi:hypothetical protein
MIRLFRAYQNQLVHGEVDVSMFKYPLPVALLAVVVVARWTLFHGLQISAEFSQFANSMRGKQMARRSRTRQDRGSKQNRARHDEIESTRWNQVVASSNPVEDADPEEVETRLRNLTHGTNGE